MTKKQMISADGFCTVRCPRCKGKHRPGKIGEFRGIPPENFEVGFWCRDCKMSIRVHWVKTCTGMVMLWRV
jgi:hypothetical protein